MRRCYALLLLLFWSVAGDAQDRQGLAATTNVYDEAGKLQMVIIYDPGCSCRTYTEFYHSGRILARRTFRIEGKKEFIDGEDITYYPGGTIKHFKLWKASFPEGRAYSNFEDGRLEHEAFYKDKHKSGTWRYFNNKGELVKELIFEEGKTAWNAKKNIAIEKRYADGRLISSTVAGVAPAAKAIKKQEDDAGPKLFQANCASCHAADKPGRGPALAGVVRRRKPQWLQQMIRDGMLLVQMEDREALALYRKWNQVKHPNFGMLQQEEITAIVAFLATLK